MLRSEALYASFRANFSKYLIELKRYLPNTVSMVLTFYAIFVFMFLGVRFLGDPSMADANLRYLIVANGFWFLLMLGVQSLGWELSNEALRGTLEQLYMSTLPTWLILLFRMVTAFLVNLLILAVLTVLSMLTAGVWLSIDVAALAVLLPATMLGVTGLGFVVAGLTIVYKQVNAMLQLLQFVLMGIAYAPLSLSPLMELAPAAKGIDMVRQVMAEGRALGSFTSADWASLLLNGVCYLLVGLAVFKLLERHAMRRGLLGHY